MSNILFDNRIETSASSSDHLGESKSFPAMKRQVRPGIRLSVFLSILLLIFFGSMAEAGQKQLKFTSEHWKLSGQTGKLLEQADGVKGPVLEITGDGSYSNAWIFRSFPLIPSEKGKLSIGCLRFKARRTSGSGGIMTGFDFANYDMSVSNEWKTINLTFIIPSGRTSGDIRLGQWNVSATIQFAEPEFFYVTPYTAKNGLGNNESFEKNQQTYQYASRWGKDCGNYSRTVEEVRVSFNSNRWCFGSSSVLVYRFDAPPAGNGKFYSASVGYTIGYYSSGTLTPEFSTDREKWTALEPLGKSGSVNVKLPEFKDGVKTVWVRFQGTPQTNLQLYSMKFTGSTQAPGPKSESVNNNATSIKGNTIFWELVEGDPGFPVPDESELDKTTPGDRIFEKTVHWNDVKGTAKSAKIRCQYYVSDFYREDYGYRLGLGGSCPLWWCESSYKITQKRAIPKGLSKKLELSAAQNDFESLQIVLRPKTNQKLKSVQISELKNQQGQTISSDNVKWRKVYYHFVDNPTDYTGVRDYYPDALVPMAVPFEMTADQNCPLYLTVYVPEKTAPGLYQAEIALEIETEGKIKKSVFPLTLRVWNFCLPKRNHLETAFGYSPGTSWRYHGVKTDADRRKINDLYFRLLSDYRISPYNPTPMSNYKIKFIADKDHPEKSRAEIDFTDFDRELEEAFQKYNFTGFQLRIHGLGGGTYQSRSNPSINGFGEETPQYQAMFASEVKQLQDHLEKKGWLDKIYIYWFDEPDTKDYEFVKNGMNRIKKYAPKLRTMLTEEPSEKVLKDDLLGKIDVWCPVTPNFNADLAEICFKKNEIFWWYVCCWPHAPYCTEFTDHNAVELRTWLWQTWKYKVSGILVWTSNFWTSGTAFPDSAQNPYLDTMCYVSDSSLAPGTKNFWGNGDGRFYYPPLSCAQPSKTPCFEEPVPSIRLEMIREGIEDFEMLYLLKEKLAENKTISAEQRTEFEKLLVVPSEITVNMTEFSTSPLPIYRHRAKVAQAIETLQH